MNEEVIRLVQKLKKSRRETEATDRLGWVYVDVDTLDELIRIALSPERENK